MNINYATKCPNCGGYLKNFATPEIYGGIMHISWGCKACGHTGTAIYNLKFDGHYWVTNEAGDITSTRNYPIADLKQSK